MVLKKLVGRINVRGVNVSNHTMRKTFARSLWENTGENDAALILLSEILGHSSTAITRIYLGITDDEISKAYKTLSLKPIKKLK
jgi:integrase